MATIAKGFEEITWLIDVGGGVHGRRDGVQRGDKQVVPELDALRYYGIGMAQPASEPRLRRAYQEDPAAWAAYLKLKAAQ
jgi:hypothetical protein